MAQILLSDSANGVSGKVIHVIATGKPGTDFSFHKLSPWAVGVVQLTIHPAVLCGATGKVVPQVLSQQAE